MRREEKEKKKKLTNGNHITHSTKNAKIISCAHKRLASTHERNGHGNHITQGQENDTRSVKGVKGGTGAQIDDTENQLHRHTEHHSVQGHIELLVDRVKLELTRTGNGTITSKRPRAARGGRRAAGSTEEAEDDDGHTQGKGASLVANGARKNGGKGLTGRIGGDGDEVGKDKHQGHQEDEAAGPVEDEGADQGLRDLLRRPLNLLTHADDHACSRGGVCGVQQTNAECPSGRRPAREDFKVAKGVGSAAAAFFRNGQPTDDDGKNSDKGEAHGQGIDEGKMFVQQRRDGVANQSDGDEDEVDLVGLGGEDASSRHFTRRLVQVWVALEDVDTSHQKEGRTEVDGEGDDDVAQHKRPAGHPCGQRAAPARREHIGLVVDTTGSRVDGSDFGQRNGNGQHEHTHQTPAPDDGRGTTVGQRIEQGGRESIGYRGQHKGHERHAQGRSVTNQFLGISQRRQHIFRSTVDRVQSAWCLGQSVVAIILFPKSRLGSSTICVLGGTVAVIEGRGFGHGC